MSTSHNNQTEVYLSATDAGLRQAVNKLEGVKSEVEATDTGRRESSFSIEVSPTEHDPWESTAVPAPKGMFFVMDIPSASILVESIQVRTSDTDLPFRLMVFESDPVQNELNHEQEDIIQMAPVSRRTYNYSTLPC